MVETITWSVTTVPGGYLSNAKQISLSGSKITASSKSAIQSQSDNGVAPTVTYSVDYNLVSTNSSRSITPEVTFSGTAPTSSGTYVKIVYVNLGTSSNASYYGQCQFKLTITVSDVIRTAFTSTSTNAAISYTIPDGVYKIKAIVIGGGGGGSGAAVNSSNTSEIWEGGGGGAGGAYVISFGCTPGNTLGIRAGQGGAGGRCTKGTSGTSSYAGNTGSTSYITMGGTTLVTAPAGIGASAAKIGTTDGTGGSGGSINANIAVDSSVTLLASGAGGAGGEGGDNAAAGNGASAGLGGSHLGGGGGGIDSTIYSNYVTNLPTTTGYCMPNGGTSSNILGTDSAIGVYGGGGAGASGQEKSTVTSIYAGDGGSGLVILEWDNVYTVNLNTSDMSAGTSSLKVPKGTKYTITSTTSKVTVKFEMGGSGGSTKTVDVTPSYTGYVVKRYGVVDTSTGMPSNYTYPTNTLTGTVSGDTDLLFEATIYYKVSFSTSNCTVSPTSISVEKGTTYSTSGHYIYFKFDGSTTNTVTITPTSGYGLPAENYPSGTVTSAKTVYVTCSRVSVNLYATNGTLSESSFYVPAGSTYSTSGNYIYFYYNGSTYKSAYATANKGYKSPSWTSRDTSTSIVSSSNNSFTVTYTPITYAGVIYLGTGYKQFKIYSADILTPDSSEYSGKYYETAQNITYNINGRIDVDWVGDTVTSEETYKKTTISYNSTNYMYLDYTSSSAADDTSSTDSKTFSEASNCYIYPNPKTATVASTTYEYRCRVTFYPNGGTGSSQSAYSDWYSYDTNIPLTVPVSFTKTYYTLLGWSTSSSATSPTYTGSTIYLPSNTAYSLYAVWGKWISFSFYNITCSASGAYVPSGASYKVSVTDVENGIGKITFTYNNATYSEFEFKLNSNCEFDRISITNNSGISDSNSYLASRSGKTDDIKGIGVTAVKWNTLTIKTVGCTATSYTLGVKAGSYFTVSDDKTIGTLTYSDGGGSYTSTTITPLAGYENPVWSPSKIIDIRSDQTITVECSKINYKATVYLSQSDGIEQYAKVTVTRNGTSTDYTENSEIVFNVDDKISAVWYANTVESTADYEKTYTTYNRCAEIAFTGGDSEGGVISYGGTVTMPAFTGSYSASIRPCSSAIVTSVKKYYRAYISFKADGGTGTLPGVYDYGYSSGAGYTKWVDDESNISTLPGEWLVAENTSWTKDQLEKENYHLIGWYLDSDDDVIPLDSNTIDIGSKGAHTLTAVWEGDPVEHFFTSEVDNVPVAGITPVHPLIIETGYTYQSQKKTEEHLSVPGSLTADYGTTVSFKADATSEGGNYYPVYKKVTVSRIKGILSLGGKIKTHDTPLYESDSYNTLSFTVDKEFTEVRLRVTAYTFKIVYNAGDRDISYTDTATYYQGVCETLPTLESIYSASQDTAFYSNYARTFKGWALSLGTKTVTYTDGQSEVYFSTYTSENTPTDNDTLTLYAVWEYNLAYIQFTPKPSDRCSKVIDIFGDTLIDSELPRSVIWPLAIGQYSTSRGLWTTYPLNVVNGDDPVSTQVSDGTPHVKITPAGLSIYYENYKKYKTVEFIGHESSISTEIYFSTADDKGNHSATVEYIPKTARDSCTLSFEAFGYTLILHRNKESSDNGNKEDTATLSIQYWQALETVLPPYNNIADIDSDWSYGDRKFLGWATSKDSIVPDSEYMDGATVCYSKLDDDAAATPSDSDELNLYAVWSAEVLICIAPNPDDSSENYWVQTSAGSMQIKYIFEKGATPRNSDKSINTDKRRDLNGDPLETPASSDPGLRFEGWKCISWGSDVLKSTSELMAYKFAGNKLTEYYVYASFTDKVYYPISFVDKDGYAYHFRDNTDQSFNLETTRTVDKVNSVTGALIEQDASFTPDPKNRKWQSDQSSATISGTATEVDVPRTGVTYYEDYYPSGTPDEVTLAIRCPGESVLHLGTIQSVSNSYSASLTTLPVLPYGYSGTFCMDLGVQRSISVSTVRVTPANSNDISADSRHWSNRKWLWTLKNLSDRWQMNTNGVSLWMYVPAEMAHNMPNLTVDKDNIAEATEGTWSRVNAYISSLPISYSAGDMHRLALTLTFRVGTIYPKPPTVEYSQISLVKDGVTKRIISAPMNSSYVVPGCDSAILPISEGLFEGWVYKFDGKLYQPGDILKTYYYNTDGIKTPIDDEDSKLSVKYTSLSKGGYVYYYDSEEFSNGVGTITVPTGKTKVTICAVGGGGAGGYPVASAGGKYGVSGKYLYAGGGGGGSGYYMVRRINLSDLGDDVATLHINVGKGGIVEGITSLNDMNGHATYVRIGDKNGRVLAIAYGGECGGSSKTGGSGGKGYMVGGKGGYAYPTTNIASNPKPEYVDASPGSSVLDKGGKAGVYRVKLPSTGNNQSFYGGGGGGGGEPPIFGGVDGYGGNGVTDSVGDSLKDGKNGGGGGGAQKASAETTDGIPGKGGDGYVYLIWE